MNIANHPEQLLPAIDETFLEARRAELARVVGEIGAHELAATPGSAPAHPLHERSNDGRPAAVADAGFHQAGIGHRAVGRGDCAVLLDRMSREVETEVLALRRHLLGPVPGLGFGQPQRRFGVALAAEQGGLAALAFAFRGVVPLGSGCHVEQVSQRPDVVTN